MCAEDAQVTCKREIRTKQETENRKHNTQQQPNPTKAEGKVRTSGRLRNDLVLQGRSIMLPTSARVSQEVYGPLIGIHPMLCSRVQDTWQIGTASIRADHCVATGLRHDSQSDEAVNHPQSGGWE